MKTIMQPLSAPEVKPTVGERIKNFKFKTERLVIVMDSYGARIDNFFLTDLNKAEVTEFIDPAILALPLLKERHYVAHGVKTVQLMYR